MYSEFFRVEFCLERVDRQAMAGTSCLMLQKGTFFLYFIYFIYLFLNSALPTTGDDSASCQAPNWECTRNGQFTKEQAVTISYLFINCSLVLFVIFFFFFRTYFSKITPPIFFFADAATFFSIFSKFTKFSKDFELQSRFAKRI